MWSNQALVCCSTLRLKPWSEMRRRMWIPIEPTLVVGEVKTPVCSSGWTGTERDEVRVERKRSRRST